MDFKTLIGKRLNILAPLVKSHKGDIGQLLTKIGDDGFLKVRINGELMDLYPIVDMKTSPYISYDIDIVVDRMRFEPDSDSMKRFAESVECAVKYGNGSNEVIFEDNDTKEEFRYILKK